MATARRTLPWLAAVVFVTCCAAGWVRWRWDGRAALTMPFDEALATLVDRSAPVHHRRAAAALLTAHCRLAVRVLRSADDLDDHVDLLLQDLAAMIRAPR